jgi:tRNA(Ile)-lysidine synthase
LVKDFKLADQKLALRAWIRRRGFRIPSQVVIERILHEVLPASPDKNPQVVWGGGEIRRYRDGLFVIPHLPRIDATAKLDWDGNSPLVLPDNNGRLIPIPDAQSGIAAEYWATGVVINVGFRQGGEVCRLPGRSGRHDLKKLFQEKGIVPWLRDRAPLVYIGGELAAVGGWWVCEPFAGQEGANNIALVWEHPAMHASQSAKAEKTTAE